MKTKFILTTFIAALLSACSTGYHSRGFFGGGYSEIITSPDSFVVTFKGNGYTSSEKVLQYVLLRASELTLQNGYKYFVIVSSADQTSSYNYSNTHGNTSSSTGVSAHSKRASPQHKGTGSISTYSGTVVKPGSTIRIKCFNDKPETDDVIDAEFYFKANSDK